jgi:hypothetical protein
MVRNAEKALIIQLTPICLTRWNVDFRTTVEVSRTSVTLTIASRERSDNLIWILQPRSFPGMTQTGQAW